MKNEMILLNCGLGGVSRVARNITFCDETVSRFLGQAV